MSLPTAPLPPASSGRAARPGKAGSAGWAIQWQIWFSHLNPVFWGALCLLISGAGLWAGLLMHYRAVAQTDQTQMARLNVAAAAEKSPKNTPPAHVGGTLLRPVTDTRPLALFYNVLAQDDVVEQQIGALFTMAQNNGLLLQRGDYKYDVDRHSGVILCHIIFPVKGSYNAIWQFALQSLQAMPFASLDNLSFRREGIAVAAPEAQLSFTLYLKGASQPEPVREASP